MNVFLEKRGFTDDSVLHDPIYCGQVRVIPADQLKEACAWLRQKIATESTIRPEQMERYQDTLRMLSDRLRDSQGTESIPLTEADAKALAVLAKEGDISTGKIETSRVSADEVIHFEYLAKQAFKSTYRCNNFCCSECCAGDLQGNRPSDQERRIGRKTVSTYRLCRSPRW